jgi:hypothetical protein
MSERRIGSYEEFWSYYVREHSDPTNRLLHFIGSSGAIAFTVAALVRREPAHLLHALVSGYGAAWLGHFAFEGNRPASWKYPLWSFISDWKMYAKILTGAMDGEVARVLLEEEQRRAAEAKAQAAKEEPRPEPAVRLQDLN